MSECTISNVTVYLMKLKIEIVIVKCNLSKRRDFDVHSVKTDSC